MLSISSALDVKAIIFEPSLPICMATTEPIATFAKLDILVNAFPAFCVLVVTLFSSVLSFLLISLKSPLIFTISSSAVNAISLDTFPSNLATHLLSLGYPIDHRETLRTLHKHIQTLSWSNSRIHLVSFEELLSLFLNILSNR